MVSSTAVQRRRHDSWPTFKPIAVICTIGGILPWPWPQLSRDPWPLTHRWPAMTHLVLLGSYVTTFVLEQPLQLSHDWPDMSPTEIFALGLFYASIYVCPWINLALMQGRAKGTWTIPERIMAVDFLHPNMLNSENSLKRKGLVLILLAVLLPLVQVAGNIFSLVREGSHEFEEASNIAFIVFSWHSLFLFHLVPLQVMFLSMVIKDRFRQLASATSSLCRRGRPLFSTTKTPAKAWASDQRHVTFEELGHMYLELCDLTNQVGEVYGIPLLVTYTVFFNVIITTMFALFDLHWNLESMPVNITFVACVTISVLSLVLFTCIVADISNEATKPLKDLLSVRLFELNPSTQQQLHVLIKQMSGPPVQVTAANFFPITRGLLTSIAGSITTYLIVLAQFRGAETGSEETANRD